MQSSNGNFTDSLGLSFMNANLCLEPLCFLFTTLEFLLKIFIIVGYVQKITARKDIEVMVDLDNGKPP